MGIHKKHKENTNIMIELTTGILIAYGAILTMAVIPIYLGSLLSVKRLSPNDDEDDSNNDDKKKSVKSSSSVNIDTETMSSKDAYMFPVVGSCVLFGLYILFTLFSKEYINFLLTAYFLLFGIGALTTTTTTILEIFPFARDSKQF